MLHHGGLVLGTRERRREAIGHAMATSGFFSREVNSGEPRNLSWGQVKNFKKKLQKKNLLVQLSYYIHYTII